MKILVTAQADLKEDFPIEKPESKSQVPNPSPKSNRKGKEEFGLWAVSKILEATHHTHPPQPQLLNMKEDSNNNSFGFDS